MESCLKNVTNSMYIECLPCVKKLYYPILWLNLRIFVLLQTQSEEQRMMSTEKITAPVTLTAGALAELKKLIEQQEIGPDFGLRVGVEGGGCSGMSYILGFDQKK